MDTAVYLSNNQVHVVLGDSGKKFKIRKVCSMVMKSECMINGVVTSEADFIREFTEFWQKNSLPKKNVILVVNSSQFALKAITVPTVGEKKTLEMVTREYSDADRADEPIYDYFEIARNNTEHTTDIFTVMAPGTYIRNFGDLFAKMGITLKGIIPSQMSAVKLLSTLKRLKQETAIILILDGTMLINLLWVNGKYNYSQRTRMINDPGTEAFVNEIVTNVNSMNQFSVSQRNSSPVSSVYMCGVALDVVNYCVDAIGDMGIILKKLPESDPAVGGLSGKLSLADSVSTLGALLTRKIDVNLIEAAKERARKATRTSETGKLVTPVIITAVVCALTMAGFLIVNAYYNNKLEERTAYLMDPLNIKASQDAAALVKENEALSLKLRAVTNALDTLAGYPRMNSDVLAEIDSCGLDIVTMQLTGYNASTGQLTFVAKAGKVVEINHYIDRLKATGLFDTVQYTGYTYSTGERLYRINVACYLNSEAGWESVEE
ncbi:MAG: hypothetical protein GX061_07295 [Eubacteriaceae bacterium]|nr:hypothetical protein [Eubacteriaceae bacterium]